MEHNRELSEPTAQTCPECGGAMREEKVGSLITFRCHIGHVMTAEVLAFTQLEILRNTISTVLRLLNERASICHEVGEKHLAAGNRRLAARWSEAARQAADREDAVQLLVKSDWVQPEGEPAKDAAE